MIKMLCLSEPVREGFRSPFRKGKLDENRGMDQANRSFFTDPGTIRIFNR
jgi:hypothetical protein